MCGRFVLVQKIERIAERYNTSIPRDINYEPSYNISPGSKTLVVINDGGFQLRSLVFGLTPFWAKKQMYLFNARSEGDRNKDNIVNYSGTKDIINKPAFRKAIRSQRCLVPADAYIEGSSSEGLNNPYLVYLRNKVRPFSFAGIWDKWQNIESNVFVFSFSIITTVSNLLIQKIPHHRSPVILHANQESAWLNALTPLNQITAMLRPFDSNLMNAYPIDSLVKNPTRTGRNLIEPVGDRLFDEDSFNVAEKIVKSGFGRHKIN